MRFQSYAGKLLISPEPGYSPHIGVLVSTMQRCRETTILFVQDLSIGNATEQRGASALDCIAMH